MLKARTRDLVAMIIVTVAIVGGGLLGWKYATANVVDSSPWRAAAGTTQVDDLRGSAVVVAGRSISSDWTVEALGHLGIPIATAEKATVALYGAILGGVIGMVLSALLSEPIAVVITAWPRHAKRVRADKKSRRRHADGLRD